MKVLLTSSLVPWAPSGVVVYYKNLEKELVNTGYDVCLVTPDLMPKQVRWMIGLMRRTLPLMGKYGKILHYEIAGSIGMFAALTKLKNGPVEVIHAQDQISAAMAKIVYGKSVPVVMTCHFNDDPLTEVKKRAALSGRAENWLKSWYSYLFSKIDGFITVSDYIKRTSANLRPQEKYCRVIHNGVSFSVSQPSDMPQNGAFVITNVGYLEDRKNQILLINAVAELVKQGEKVQLWLFGDGPRREEWEALARQLDIQEEVIFWGHQEAPQRYVRQSHLYVHTAVNESWCLAITEAIAARVPTLALAVGGIPEQFPQGNAGLLNPSVSAVELAGAIKRFMVAESRQTLQQEQYEYAYPRLTIRHMAEQTVQAYEEVIQAGTRLDFRPSPSQRPSPEFG